MEKYFRSFVFGFSKVTIALIAIRYLWDVYETSKKSAFSVTTDPSDTTLENDAKKTLNKNLNSTHSAATCNSQSEKKIITSNSREKNSPNEVVYIDFAPNALQNQNSQRYPIPSFQPHQNDVEEQVVFDTENTQEAIVTSEPSCDCIEDLGEKQNISVRESSVQPDVLKETSTAIRIQNNRKSLAEPADRNVEEDGDTNKQSQMLLNSEYTFLPPGKQKGYLRTFGCSHNVSDFEFMMGLLNAYGYTFVDTLKKADFCLINSCTVKSPSQSALTNLIQKAKELHIPVIATGCVPQADQHLKDLENVSIVGVTQIDRVVEVVEQALSGNVVRLLRKKALPSLDLPKIRKNNYIEIIPLSTGCLGACSYCKTRHARGKLGSYTVDAILRRAKNAIGEGVQQIWLTSEDTGAYGLDIETNIAFLLQKIVQILPEHVMLRLGMTNPPYIMAHIDSVIEILHHPRVFEFIHIPVQSGSNETLKHMVREYTVEEFESLVTRLKNGVPRLTVATDIICGFPTEIEEHHIETVELVKRHKFPVINISKFYARPDTAAAKMMRIPTQIVKKRSSELTALFESYETNSWLLNTIQQVWFCEHSNQSPHTVGHSKTYVKVLVDRDDGLIGQSRNVIIQSCHKWHVVGQCI